LKTSETIVKDSLAFSGSTYFSYIFKIITNLVVRRFLSPAVMGLFSELMLVNQYSKLHHLGMLTSLHREIPFYRGKNDTKKVDELKSNAFTFCLITAVILAVTLIAVSEYLKHINYDEKFILGLFLISLIIVVEMIVSYYSVILRTHNKFFFLGKFNILLAIIEVLLTVFLIMRFGLNGIFLALFFTFFLGAIYLFFFSGFNLGINLKVPLKEIKRLLSIGIPIELSSLSRMLFSTIDRFMIIIFLGRLELGLYSIATMAYNFLLPLPRGVYSVIFPKFIEEFGKSDDIKKVRDYLVKPTMIFAYLFPIVIGIILIILPLVVEYILPRYQAGLFSANILVLSTFFHSLTFMWGILLIAIYKQIKMVQFNIMAIFISIFFNYLFVRIFCLGINGIAFGTTLTHFILSTVFISYVFSFYTRDIKEHLLLFIKIYFPLLWIVSALFFLKIFFDYRNLSMLDDVFHSFVLIVTLVLFSLPLVGYVNKQTQIITIIKNTITDSLSGKGSKRA
jgi:O-antigen/teichoic acid export membrane protein